MYIVTYESYGINPFKYVSICCKFRQRPTSLNYIEFILSIIMYIYYDTV